MCGYLLTVLPVFLEQALVGRLKGLGLVFVETLPSGVKAMLLQSGLIAALFPDSTE